MRRRPPMSAEERRREIAKAKRYLDDALDEQASYPFKKDLVGRALKDQVKRMRRILQLVLEGVPFGVGKNK